MVLVIWIRTIFILRLTDSLESRLRYDIIVAMDLTLAWVPLSDLLEWTPVVIIDLLWLVNDWLLGGRRPIQLHGNGVAVDARNY